MVGGNELDLSDSGQGRVIDCSQHGNSEKISVSEGLCSMLSGSY